MGVPAGVSLLLRGGDGEAGYAAIDNLSEHSAGCDC